MKLDIKGVRLEKQSFQNDFKKLPVEVKQEATERFALLIKNSQAGKLRAHALNGYHPTVYTIDVTSGKGKRYKASFRLDGDFAVFLRVGTHKEIDRKAD